MSSKSTRPLVALAAVAALAVPAAAAAKGPAAGHGRGADHAQAGQHGHRQESRPPKVKTRALNLKGTVAAVGDGTIDVLVTSANHHGRVLRGQTVTVDVSNARIVVRDVNGDGVRDLADVAVGDRVVVHSRIAKGAAPDPAQPLVAKRVVDQGSTQVKPDPGTGGDEPPTGGDEPPTGGDQPPTGGDQPPTGGDQPPTADDQPPSDTPPAP
jgi:hypothetical protein